MTKRFLSRTTATLIALGLCTLPTMPAWSAESAVVKSYKRDPVPIYDDDGVRVRTVPRKEMPAPGKTGVKVVRSKQGFVGIMLKGELAWLRLSMVDFVGDVQAVECDAMAMQFAKMEEDGVEQSLGLGCAY